LSVLIFCESINRKSEDKIRETLNIAKPEISRTAEGKKDEKVTN
jgi:hypothetical protein